MKLKNCCAYIFALIMASCSAGGDYRDAIPSRAAAVVSVDLNSMFAKSGLDDENLQNRIKTMMKSGLEGADGLIDKVFADVSETGLGLSDKIYVFAGEQSKVGGLLVKVDDEDRLGDLLEVLSAQHVCKPVKETDGCKWTIAGNVLLAYKSHAMLLVADNKNGNPSSLLRQASMWLRQEKDESFSSSSGFKQMNEQQSDIVSWSTLEVLPSYIINNIVMGVSAELSMRDVKAVSVINFNKGKINIDVETFFDDRIMKGIIDKKNESMLHIKGDYLDVFPANTPFWAAANIKGGEFFDFICGNPLVRRYFEKSMLPVDFRSVFDAIEGDVSLAISGTNSSEFIAFADVKSDKFLKSFEALKGMASMSGGQVVLRNHGDNGYEFKTNNGSIVGLPRGYVALWIGVKDDKLYVTNKEQFIDRRVLGLSLRNKEWGNRVEGNTFFMSSDVSSLYKITGIEKKGGGFASAILSSTDYFTVSVAKDNDIHIEIIMKNKDKNPLSVMLNR